VKTLVVVQARMGSSRLPGKVALEVAGAPLLVRMLERLRAVATPVELCVATSTLPEDDRVVELATQAGVRHHRGDPLDCLNRHATAAAEAAADFVVKIPSDCPLIDPAVVDEVLGVFFRDPARYDYVVEPPPGQLGRTATTSRSFTRARARARRPRGNVRALEREHTTPFFWDRPRPLPPRQRSSWGRGRDLSDVAPHHRRLPRGSRRFVRGGLRRRSTAEGEPPFTLDDVVVAARRPARHPTP
jgi:spore coat polysaccharide biosynthesis protein SpsF